MSRVRIVKGKILELVDKDYNLYSDSNITYNATEIITEKGESSGVSYGNPARPPAGEIKAKCLVKFRPHDTYKDNPGFGFDWLREADSGQKGDNWFGGIMGKYYEADNVTPFHDTNHWNNNFRKEPAMYDKKLKSYKSFALTWKKVNKKAYLYPVPMLTLLKGKSALFNLKIEIQEKPKKLTFEFKDKEAEKYLSLNIKEIGDIKKGKYDKFNYFKITCTESFSKEQVLYVKADGEICGALRIHPNAPAFLKKINVVFVKVKTDINGPEVKGEPVAGGKDFFIKCFNQALVIPAIQEVVLNCKSNLLGWNTFKNKFCTPGNLGGGKTGYMVTKDAGMREYLEGKLKDQFGDKYKGFFTVFFIGDRGAWNGFAYFDSTFGVYFSSHNKATLAHENMHAMNMPHTFASKDQGKAIAKYTYQAKTTNNIMDYSHLDGIDRFCLFMWQWKVFNSKIST